MAGETPRVTARKCLTRCASDTRNATERALDAELVRLGITPPSDAERAARALRRETVRLAHRCHKCGDALGPDAIVWRIRTGLGPSLFGNGYRFGVVPWCEPCAVAARHDRRTWLTTGACVGCGRTVVDTQGPLVRWAMAESGEPVRHPSRMPVVACGEACRLAEHRRRAAERRALAKKPRERDCADCGKPFTPPRDDAVFCSGACKQRTYRRRTAIRRRFAELEARGL